jgi:hypothetical protein
MTRLRLAILLSVLSATVLLVAGCGGSDKASSSTDVNDLLAQTFSGNKKVKSGKLDLGLQLDAKGGSSQLNGPVNVRLVGPFQTEDAGTLPKFKLDVSFEGAGQSLKAGATSTGDKGFLSFQGTDYAVSDSVFKQFKAGFEQSAKQSGSKGGQSFASLGMDPRKWLTNARNEGEAKVGDDDTIKITGGIDVPKLLDDVNKALSRAGSLGLAGAGQVPSKLTDAQKRQVAQSVKDPRVEIYTGKDDKILRRLVVNLGVNDKQSGTNATIGFNIAITDLNEDQDIPAPSNAKPFDQLLSQLGALQALGGASSSGSGSSSGSKANAGGDLEKYSKCVTEAGNDVKKARKCADLLSG